MKDWVRLYRMLLTDVVWTSSTPEQKAVLVVILLSANYTKKEWEWKGQKFICEPGQFITSLSVLSAKAGVSTQNVRSAIKRFKKFNFLTEESTKQGRLITVCKWEVYQPPKIETQQSSQQTGNKGPTTTKNIINKETIKSIVDYLNSKTGKSFKPNSKDTIKHISARFNESYSQDDFFKVIDIKSQQWLNTEQEKYLRPQTLFGSKFESYLNEKPINGNLEPTRGMKR